MNFSGGRYRVRWMQQTDGGTGGAQVRRTRQRWGARLLGRRWSLLPLLAFPLGCALFRSAVNDSPAIRWWLFSHYGADRLCPEMLRRSAPLRLTPGSNVIGRLFPTSCQSQVNDARRTVSLDFSGNGYAWTPLAGRVNFSTHAGMEYRADFSMEDDAIYVWARSASLLFPVQFRVDSIQNRLVDWATQQSVGAYLANVFGAQVTTSQLASGFTVVRSEEGDAFSLGILQPPARPPQPFRAGGDDRQLVETATVEVRVEQVDFLGPIQVEGSGQEVFFKYQLNGPAAEALLYTRADAQSWRERLQQGAAFAPPVVPALMSFPLRPGQASEQRFRMPPGQYVLVVDHTSQLGSVSPPYNPLNSVGANPLVLSYRLELGE
ncbi:MAG: hypothetical protein RL033_1274 [Pseudomonadota bacterium]|jgi:hypothetical protein